MMTYQVPQKGISTGGCARSPERCNISMMVERSRLSLRAGECRSTEDCCRQAGRETLKRGFRQDSEHRTGTRKILQGSDTLFRKSDTACRSRRGFTPDWNQSAIGASNLAVPRRVHEKAA